MRRQEKKPLSYTAPKPKKVPTTDNLGFASPDFLPSPLCYGPAVTREEMAKGYRVIKSDG